MDGTPRRCMRRWMVTAGLLVAIWGPGCASRKLTWHYAPDAPKRIAKARRIAVVAEASLTRHIGLFGGDHAEEFVNAIIGELMTRGYEVMVLRQDPLADPPTRPYFRVPHAATQPTTPPGRRTISSAAAADRCALAEHAHADLLVECSTLLSHEMDMEMMISPIPIMPKSVRTRWRTEVRRISLRISSPRGRTVLGTATVRYPGATSNFQKVIKDVFLGFDLIRSAEPGGTIKLSGKPGKRPKKLKRRDEPRSAHRRSDRAQ